MLRFMVTTVLILIVGVPTIGCVRTTPTKGPTGVAKGTPIQEKDAPVKPLILPGRWRATGHDQAGYQWVGYLIVDHAPDNYMKAGYFEWEVKTGGGRYHFEGKYDPETRAVVWPGYSISERVGGPAMATYQATLSADGKRLENGSWAGGISIPGKWSAEYVGD